MNFKKLIPICLTLLVFLSTIAVSSNYRRITESTKNKAKETISATSTPDNKSNEEMRGVWITYMELSMENEKDKSEKRFKEKFEKIASDCKNFGFNTLIVQVRPFCDAIYKSDYFPWSHILTGTQGKNPGYDALKIICEICKEKNLKIHAWVNPFRVSTGKTPNKLSENNPYSSNESLGIKTDSGIILDPSNEDAQKLIISGIDEIIENYDVDGIQFDDYFYPTDIDNLDKNQYQEYANSRNENRCMDIDTWRKNNINLLICNSYKTIHKSNKNIDFGISPQGNIDNNDELYADVKTWCTTRGFIDYICPQIYFSLDNPALTFEDSLNSWKSLEFADEVALYVGIAGYKAGTDSDQGTWLNNSDILAQEYSIIKTNKSVKGFMFYSYTNLDDEIAKDEINNLKKSLN